MAPSVRLPDDPGGRDNGDVPVACVAVESRPPACLPPPRAGFGATQAHGVRRPGVSLNCHLVSFAIPGIGSFYRVLTADVSGQRGRHRQLSLRSISPAARRRKYTLTYNSNSTRHYAPCGRWMAHHRSILSDISTFGGPLRTTSHGSLQASRSYRAWSCQGGVPRPLLMRRY